MSKLNHFLLHLKSAAHKHNPNWELYRNVVSSHNNALRKELLMQLHELENLYLKIRKSDVDPKRLLKIQERIVAIKRAVLDVP